MKKILSILAVFILCLSGCTSGEESAGDGTVTVYNLKVEIDEALKEYAAEWSESTGIPVEIKTVGGGADYSGALQAEFQSGNAPDIFVSTGAADFDLWQDVSYDMSGEEWTNHTELEYIDENDAVVGFPISIEGYGLIANTDILSQAGINAEDINSVEKLEEMFTILSENAEELGIEAPLSMTTKETWVTGNHLNNILLGGSGETPDAVLDATHSYIDGDADALSYDGFAEYTEMLYNNSYGDLTTIDYDTQVSNFTTGKTALLFQGNWVIPNLEAANFDIDKLVFIPHMYNDNTENKLAASVPSYYIVNKEQDVENSLKFLNDMATTEEGENYIVNEAKMVPTFNDFTIEPSDTLSIQIMEASNSGDIIPFGQNEFPDGYAGSTFGPIYDNFYQNGDKDKFIENIKSKAGDQ